MIRTRSFIVGSLFGITLMLVLLGIIMVLSSSKFLYTENPNLNVYIYMGKQLMFFSLGLAGLSFLYTIDFNVWERWSRGILFVAIVLLALVLTELGYNAKGAQRWFWIAGFSFQPSEFAKFAVIIYLSAVWAERQDRLASFWQGVFYPLMVIGLVLGLVLLEPDHSTTFMIGLIALSIWFVAGGKIYHLTPAVFVMVVGLFVALYHKPYLFERILAFLNPSKYPEKYFHILQSRIGFAQGGLWGTGLGEGTQQLGFIPEVHTDFIFSTIGEELGFIWTSVVVLLFLAFIILGLIIAFRCSNPFGSLMAVGCTSAIGLQAAVNMAVVTGSIPTTGITLPFISYGGTSLVISMSMVGLLMNIAKEAFDDSLVHSEKPKQRKRIVDT